MTALSGEAAEIAHKVPRDAVAHVLARLQELVGCEAAWWTVAGNEGRLLLDSEIAGLDETTLSNWQRQFIEAQRFGAHPMWSLMFGRGSLSTFARREMVPDSTWYESPHITEFSRSLGFDDVIASATPCGGVVEGAFSVTRAWGARPFSARESAIVDQTHRSLRWLHSAALVDPRARRRGSLVAGLRKSYRDVLRLLLHGLSEKEIASSLSLSPRTVHKYVEAVYEAFVVSSRPQLMALWIDDSLVEPPDRRR